MKRKILAMLLCLVTVAGTVAGCGNVGANTTDNSNDSATEEQITVSDSTTEEENVENDATTEETTGKVEFANDKLMNLDLSVIEGYEEAAKKATGIDVTIVTSPDTASYQTSIQQSIHEESAPGLFTWWGGYQLQTLVENGLVEDLTEVWKNYITPAGVAEGVAEAFTYDGKIYAAPYNVNYNMILYNKEVFKNVGRTPDIR